MVKTGSAPSVPMPDQFSGGFFLLKRMEYLHLFGRQCQGEYASEKVNFFLSFTQSSPCGG
jgi:hypothetical protein